MSPNFDLEFDPESYPHDRVVDVDEEVQKLFVNTAEIPAREWRPPTIWQKDLAVICQTLCRCILAEGWQHTDGDLAWSGLVHWIQRIQVAETEGSYNRRTRVSLKQRGDGANDSREEKCSSTASRGVCKRLQKSFANWNLARRRRTLTYSSWNFIEDPWRCSD